MLSEVKSFETCIHVVQDMIKLTNLVVNLENKNLIYLNVSFN
jgi:hypothetical protein